MKMNKFTLLAILIYSIIVYIVNITIGPYMDLLVLALLIVMLPIFWPKGATMSDIEMKKFGKTKICYNDDVKCMLNEYERR